MKSLFFLIIITFFIGSCKGDSVENDCNVSKPLTELSWLKTEVETFEKQKQLAGTAIPMSMNIWIGKSAGASKIYIEQKKNVNYLFRTLDCSGNTICTISVEKGSCLDDFKSILGSLSLIYENK